MGNFDDFKLSIEALSGGKNTVLFDDQGMPSVMVPFPKLKMSELITGGSENLHPAFSVGGVEKDKVYVSKFQNIVLNSRAYSLPGRDPKANITFDTAFTNCRNKGNGWSLMPYSVWCAIALWCRKNGTMPRGNNDYGRDVSYTHEKGVPATYDSSNRVNHILTGSGPATWYHNWMPDGIADLNGNVSEWCAGMRLVDGELQIIPYANIFDPEVSNGATSTAWKAILEDGTLVDPGTSGSLKWDFVSSVIKLCETITTTVESKNCEYKDMALASDVSAAPEIAKALLFYPDEPNGDYGGDKHYMTNSGERLPYCGGNYTNGAGAGVFCVSLGSARSNSNAFLGFRSAFVNL